MGMKGKRKYKFEPYFSSGSPFKSWDEYMAYNRTQPCANPACDKLRHNRGKYCTTCYRHNSALGDPRLRPLKIKQYQKYIDMAKEVIAFNPDNIIVTDFREKLLTLADHGHKKLPIEWASWWAGIHEVFNHEIMALRRTPDTMIERLVGVYIFYHETGNEFINNEKSWYFTLGNIMLKGCKSKVRPPATGYRVRKFGKMVYDAFALYFIRLGRATMRNENLKRVREKELEKAELELPELHKQKKGEG